MKKLLIQTKENKIFLVKVFDGQVVKTMAINLDKESIVGNIYVGKVEKVVKNSFAFVNIGHNKNAFININDPKEEKIKNIHQSDDILVQVLRDETDIKGASLTSEIVIRGTYLMAILAEKRLVGISKKITDKSTKKRLRKIGDNFKHSVIFRTESEFVDSDIIIEEYKNLEKQLDNIISTHQYVLAPKLILDQEQNGGFISKIDKFSSDCEKIYLTDNNLYEQLKDSSFFDKVELETTVDIFSFHYVKKQVDELFQTKVWLKSGGFLIIEYTEAFVIIDVNSGKNIKEKEKDSLAFNVNKEAVTEAFKQIELRNLSGIILIDLIDMKTHAHREQILHLAKELVKYDTDFTIHGLTTLGIMEITRKKRSDAIHLTLR